MDDEIVDVSQAVKKGTKRHADMAVLVDKAHKNDIDRQRRKFIINSRKKQRGNRKTYTRLK